MSTATGNTQRKRTKAVYHGCHPSLSKVKGFIVPRVKSDELLLAWLANKETKAFLRALIDNAAEIDDERKLLQHAVHAAASASSQSSSPTSSTGIAKSNPLLSTNVCIFTHSTPHDHLSPSALVKLATKRRQSRHKQSPRCEFAKKFDFSRIPTTNKIIKRSWMQSLYNDRDVSPDEIAAERARLEKVFGDSTELVVNLKFPPPTFHESLPSPSSKSADNEQVAALLSILGVPQYLRMALILRVHGISASASKSIDVKDDKLKLPRDAFFKYWEQCLSTISTSSGRAFELLRGDAGRSYLIPHDWLFVLQDVADTHPGLRFLAQSPEFKEKYLEHVLARIFYSARSVAGSRTLQKASAINMQRRAQFALSRLNLATECGGITRAHASITYNDFKHSDILPVLFDLQRRLDLTVAPNYFDFISFYSIYLKFWELDEDRDMQLSLDDLKRYDSWALTECIIERAFYYIRFCAPPKAVQQGKNNPYPFTFADFVWFMLSAEDKTTLTALELWFRCLDYDEDGYLSPNDLYHFYEEQMYRMEYEVHDVIPFEQALIQIIDWVNPRDAKRITLQEIKSCGNAHLIYNLLFDLRKFIRDEQRYPLDMKCKARLIALGDILEFEATVARGGITAPASSPQSPTILTTLQNILPRGKWLETAVNIFKNSVSEWPGGDEYVAEVLQLYGQQSGMEEAIVTTPTGSEGGLTPRSGSLEGERPPHRQRRTPREDIISPGRSKHRVYLNPSPFKQRPIQEARPTEFPVKPAEATVSLPDHLPATTSSAVPSDESKTVITTPAEQAGSEGAAGPESEPQKTEESRSTFHLPLHLLKAASPDALASPSDPLSASPTSSYVVGEADGDVEAEGDTSLDNTLSDFSSVSYEEDDEDDDGGDFGEFSLEDDEEESQSESYSQTTVPTEVSVGTKGSSSAASSDLVDQPSSVAETADGPSPPPPSEQ